jgi:hypothetical protein
MSEKNDSVILDLKKKIEEKKALLKKAEKFNPVTNCSLSLRGQVYNLNVLTAESLAVLVCDLNAIRMSAIEMAMHDLTISGYHINEWIRDGSDRLTILRRKEEEAKLRALETKLDTLMSEDKRAEIELDKIMKELS